MWYRPIILTNNNFRPIIPTLQNQALHLEPDTFSKENAHIHKIRHQPQEAHGTHPHRQLRAPNSEQQRRASSVNSQLFCRPENLGPAPTGFLCRLIGTTYRPFLALTTNQSHSKEIDPQVLRGNLSVILNFPTRKAEGREARRGGARGTVGANTAGSD